MATRRPFFSELRGALTEAIQYHVRYQTRDGEGETRAERNARFGMSHLTPDEPDVPMVAEHVWNWFWHLSSQRRSGLNGPEPLGWEGIGYWASLTGTLVIPEEIELLVAMDIAYRTGISQEQEGGGK